MKRTAVESSGVPGAPPLAPCRRFILEIEPIGGGCWKVAPVIRLRRAMKMMRVTYGLRCVAARATEPSEEVAVEP